MNDRVHIVYRVSELSAGGLKNKPDYATKIRCLSNAVQAFAEADWTILADSISDSLFTEIQSVCSSVTRINCGTGGSAFRHAANVAMSLSPTDIVYLLEDDYLHLPKSMRVLLDGFSVGADYVTLYDHPDKYVDKRIGGNPLVRHGGEPTRVLLGKHSHWKCTNSTTMTFATRVQTLRDDWPVFSKFCGGAYTDDFRLFRYLAKWKRRMLVSSVPGSSTHCELEFLSPLVDWPYVANSYD